MSRPSLCAHIALPAIHAVLLSALAVLLPGIATRPLLATQNTPDSLRARTPADQSAAKENTPVAQLEREVPPSLEARSHQCRRAGLRQPGAPSHPLPPNSQ